MDAKDTEAINFIWSRLHQYAGDTLDNMIGNGDCDPDVDDTYADVWAEICEAMAHITERLEASQ